MPPTVTLTPPMAVARGTEDAVAVPGAREVPKIAAQVPGAREGLYEAAFTTPEIAGCAAQKGAAAIRISGRRTSNVFMKAR